MPRYLLAAEADQIQDFIFRASHLREVVGGSQLLSRFCQEGAGELLKRYGGNPAKDIIINDGGAFRIVFEEGDDARARRKAEDFGKNLAELYRRCAGGNLTVAAPVSYNGDFRDAGNKAKEALSDAKSLGNPPGTAAHLPYIAFCASCGVAAGTTWEKRHPDERENYHCASCQQKEKEREIGEGDQSGFLGLCRAAVSQAIAEAGISIPYAFDFPRDADAVARFDSRNYVAYLLADGNSMGTWFGKCNDEQMRRLSQKMPDVLRQSLASPCPFLLQRLSDRAGPEKQKQLLPPVLPLILGGDDLFALLPALWALDYAARFCQTYEERMRAALDELNLLEGKQTPTIAAAVVICKATYPYTLAHQRGEALLQQAKELAHRLEIEENLRLSTISFTVVTGNQVGGGLPGLDEPAFHPYLHPYFAQTGASSEVSIPIQRLLEQRFALKDLPGKRRTELKALYDAASVPKKTGEDLSDWRQQMNTLLARIGHRSSKERDNLKAALRELGSDNEDEGFWLRTRRRSANSPYNHGLPDLLAAWDYAHKLDVPLSKYEGR